MLHNKSKKPIYSYYLWSCYYECNIWKINGACINNYSGYHERKVILVIWNVVVSYGGSHQYLVLCILDMIT